MTYAHGEPRPVIGIDVDEVLIQGMTAAFVEYLGKKGHPVDRAMFKQTNNWSKATGYSKERLTILFDAFLSDPLTPRALPVSGAAETVTGFAMAAVPLIITARGKKIRQRTMYELHQTFNGHIRHGWFGAAGTKYHAIRCRNVVIHIDDSHHEIEQIALQVPDAWVIAFPSATARQHLQRTQRVIPLADYGVDLDELSSKERDALHRRSWQQVHDIVGNLLDLHYPLASR